ATGNLYGTTSGGGPSDLGTVFRLDASNNYTLTTLHSFSGPDGRYPYAAVNPKASVKRYGTTSRGGPTDLGTVFGLNASNNYASMTLHSFSGTDGAIPVAAVIADASGNLYGTTFRGGPSDLGTVFKLDASNNYALANLHSFSGPDGRYPYAA